MSIVAPTIRPIVSSIVRGLVSGTGYADPLVFEGISFDTAAASDGSYDAYEMLGVKTGTGDLTEARTSTIYAADHENVYRAFGSGEPAYKGGRVVENLAIYSEDVSNAQWRALGGAAKEGVVAGVGPNGEDVQEVSFSGVTTDYLDNGNTPTVAGHAYTNAITVRAKSGSTSVRVRYGSSTSANITVDENWVTICPDDVFTETVTGSRVFGVQNNTSGDSANIYVFKMQIEDTTGRSDTTTPSEYVPTTTAAAKKVFANANGNSVASNVVTEATGAALAEEPWLLAQPALTNSVAYSRDLTNAAWSETGTSVAAYDAVGMDGAANTASTLTDDDGASVESIAETITITDDSNTHTMRLFVDKDADTSRFPLFKLDYSGGTGVSHEVALNTSTGAVAESGTGSSDVRDAGNWYELSISLANNGTGNTSANLTTAPANASSLTVTPAAAATGSITVGNVELHLNTTIAEVRGSGPIFTSGASATTNACYLTCPLANTGSATQGAWFMEVSPFYNSDEDANVQVLLSAHTDASASNYIMGWKSNNRLQVEPATGTVSYINAAQVAGQQYKAGVAFDESVTKVAMTVDGVTAASQTDFGGLGYGGTVLKIGNNSGTENKHVILYRNLRRYDLSYTDAQTTIDGLMA